jgi:polar amino acid transport system substrate-binding protein
MGDGILGRVLDRGHLVLGSGSGNAPWHFEDDDGNLAGFDIAMGRIIAKALFGDPGRMDVVIQPPDARIENVLTDKVDITFQFMSFSADRLKQIAFSVPYYTEGIGLILSASGAHGSYSDLVAAIGSGSSVTVAVLANPGAAAEVDEILSGATADERSDSAAIYAAVESGQSDAGLADLSSIRWLASRHPDRYRDAGIATHPQNYGAAMRPDDQRWIGFVNGVLIDAMTGASYADYYTAYETYFGEQLVAPVVGKPGIFRFA